MGKEDIATARIAHVHRKLHEAEKLRQEVIVSINAIKDKCLSKEIPYSAYEQSLAEKRGGMSLPEWAKYYDDYITFCESQISIIQKGQISD